MYGLAQGLVAGTNLGRNVVDAYQTGVAMQDAEKRKKEDAEIAAAMKAGYENGTPNGYGVRQANDPEVQAGLQKNLAAQGGPGDAVGPTTPGLTPTSVARDLRSDEERYLDAYRNAQEKAMAIGRPDVALRAFDATLPMRHKVREDAFNRADNQFRQTGDFNAFVPFFNRFVNDGRSIDRVETMTNDKGETLYKIVGKSQDGKPLGGEWMSKDQAQTIMEHTLNPAAVRAAEAQQRARIAELAAKTAEARATKPKDFVLEMDPDKTYTTADGKVIQRGTRLKEVKNEDGSTHIEAWVDGKPVQVQQFGEKDGPAGITGNERKGVYNDASKLLDNNIRVATGNMGSPADAKTLEASQAILQTLIVANRNNAAGTDAGVLAQVAAQLATGKAKIEKLPLNDGKGSTADGVRIILPSAPGTPPEKQTSLAVFINPSHVKAATDAQRQRDGAVANSPDRGAPESNARLVPGRAEFNAATAGADNAPPGTIPAQAARNHANGRTIEELQSDLATLEREKGKAKGDQVAILQREIDLTKAAIDVKNGMGTPQPAAAPRPAAPASAGMAPIPAPASPAPAPAAPPVAAAPAPTPAPVTTKQEAYTEFKAAEMDLKTARAALDKLDNRGGRMRPEFKDAKAAVEAAKKRYDASRATYHAMNDRQPGLTPITTARK